MYMYGYDELEKIEDEAKECLISVGSVTELNEKKSKFFGQNGIFRDLMKSLSELSKDEKPKIGQAINNCKSSIEAIFNQKLVELEEFETLRSLGERVDVTLSKSNVPEAFIHPLTKVRNRFVEIFSKIGFVVKEGTEIESEWVCFDALNTKESHPSRDDGDTFYFDDSTNVNNVEKHLNERYLLRSHTSTVQIRTMLSQKPPIRILSPGRTFRKDSIDATHSPNFHQCEGLVVEKCSTVSDLKSVLIFFFEELIGKGCEIRMRPSYFPFVSPGFEVDFRSKNVGKLSDRWIEVCGCGMVAPSVFENCGINSDEYSGYAFGMGIERLAMLMYGIDDIRLFYQNDSRFLKQFRYSMAE